MAKKREKKVKELIKIVKSPKSLKRVADFRADCMTHRKCD